MLIVRGGFSSFGFTGLLGVPTRTTAVVSGVFQVVSRIDEVPFTTRTVRNGRNPPARSAADATTTVVTPIGASGILPGGVTVLLRGVCIAVSSGGLRFPIVRFRAGTTTNLRATVPNRVIVGWQKPAGVSTTLTHTLKVFCLSSGRTDCRVATITRTVEVVLLGSGIVTMKVRPKINWGGVAILPPTVITVTPIRHPPVPKLNPPATTASTQKESTYEHYARTRHRFILIQ